MRFKKVLGTYTHQLLSPDHSHVHVLQRTIVIFKHLCRPQSTVHVCPFILADVEKTSSILRKGRKPSFQMFHETQQHPKGIQPTHSAKDTALLKSAPIRTGTCQILTLALSSPYFRHNAHCLLSSTSGGGFSSGLSSLLRSEP